MKTAVGLTGDDTGGGAAFTLFLHSHPTTGRWLGVPILKYVLASELKENTEKTILLFSLTNFVD